jgi:class 3 adenylate cyclase
MIGTDIVRYDIYGSDVLIANKMESHGTKGRVMVSEVTKEILYNNYPNQYKFEFKEEVKIPYLDKEINAFLVDSK